MYSITDLKNQAGYTGGLEKCILLDDNIRITSEYFNVAILSMMNGMDVDISESEKKFEQKRILNENREDVNETVKVQNYVRAKNIGVYPHRYDGWIPYMTAKKLFTPTGKVSKIQSGSTSGVTEVADKHTHDIKQGLTMSSNDVTDSTYEDLEIWHAKGVDLQEINNKFIQKGHVLYGAFVGGAQNEFVIMFIEGVTPRLTEYERKADVADNPDTAVDGDKTVPNKSL